MFIDTTISYSARAFAMLTRGLVAQHYPSDIRGLPVSIIQDLGLNQGAALPVIRGIRYR